jgi:hypothetical protein
MTIFYCLGFETPPTWRARSLYLYPPRNWMARLYPQALGSLFVVCNSTCTLECVSVAARTCSPNRCIVTALQATNISQFLPECAVSHARNERAVSAPHGTVVRAPYQSCTVNLSLPRHEDVWGEWRYSSTKLSTRWRCAVRFTSPPLHPHGNVSR